MHPIELRPYDSDQDFQDVLSWCQKRGGRVTKGEFPKVGLIAPGLAAGFIIQTDTSFAIIGNYISNPGASRSQRVEALKSITEKLISIGKDLGYSGLRMDTKSTGIERLAENHGFIEVGPSTTWIKRL